MVCKVPFLFHLRLLYPHWLKHLNQHWLCYKHRPQRMIQHWFLSYTWKIQMVQFFKNHETYLAILVDILLRNKPLLGHKRNSVNNINSLTTCAILVTSYVLAISSVCLKQSIISVSCKCPKAYNVH